MRRLLVAVFMSALMSPASAWEYCYTSEMHPEVTITVDGRDMVLHSGDEDVPLTRRGAGTGFPFAEAVEEDGTVHPFRYIDGDLLFDMIVYTRGCPADATWVDRECKHVLISQASTDKDYIRFFYLEPGQLLTDCTPTGPFPFRHTRFNELRCSSGRSLKVDADDYRNITVDGIEMSQHDGPLPCGPLSKP
jgi:hypothetical protein